MDKAILKTEERVAFLTEWIDSLSEKTDFESRNTVFTLEQELASRQMYLRTIKQDMAIKQMDTHLPVIINQIDKSKLSLEDRNKFNALEKRVKSNKYANIEHKAHDFDMANQMLNSYV